MSLVSHRWDLRAAPARAAWRAWVRGDVDEAERLAAHSGPRQRARLRFLTSYVRGGYEQALAHYEAVRHRYPAWTELDEPVAHALLHLDRPAEAHAHVQRRRGRRPMPPDLVSRMDHPLRVELDHTAVLPFADHPLAPYLPAVDATLDGHPVHAHIDTGGAFLAMGTRRAEALGIRLTRHGKDHHGTTRTDLYTGMARELTLGGAALKNVPVNALPTLRDDQDLVIIGTNVLQRFLATVDHPGDRLILSKRRDPRHTADHLALLDGRRELARIPFYLWGDHYMFARGGFGPRRDLNFFIDSGLVYVGQEDGSPPRQACLYTTARHYRSWGVPRDRAARPHFTLQAPVHLGPLRQDDQFAATTPTRRVPWSSFGGVRIDALLSHSFLNEYAWTLDFDHHEYTFRHPAAAA
ncbi:retropepsin-like aspartic protease [Sphaerisporangium sp. TRM90804]|uniref:retropepsin-like aspartic protease n=1 Tax=Sphaerisporangium sp. TRM90804 TaxID=3031113 RepID=UPI00244D51F6|nr:retropepsin-like aspartic protease [Sphaerisporangium sp. TRM90804]MDH2430399.1 retropepsin-like aspartic protease [Sphaerisporangium sp. TRM90804]